MSIQEKAESHVVLGIHVTNRARNVPEMQRVLTEYGCFIRSRLGLHDVHSDFCSPSGLILLELTGDPAQQQKLEDTLKAMHGIDVKKMTFPHE